MAEPSESSKSDAAAAKAGKKKARRKKRAAKPAGPEAAAAATRKVAPGSGAKAQRGRKPGKSVDGAPSRAQFIRDALAAAPDASCAAVQKAWKTAGGKDALASSQFYMLRSKIVGGGPKRRKARRAAPMATTAAVAHVAPKSHSGYALIERELDRLVSLVGDDPLAEMLRAARRRASLALLHQSR